jgi:hypothetical protein
LTVYDPRSDTPDVVVNHQLWQALAGDQHNAWGKSRGVLLCIGENDEAVAMRAEPTPPSAALPQAFRLVQPARQ